MKGGGCARGSRRTENLCAEGWKETCSESMPASCFPIVPNRQARNDEKAGMDIR